jgi:hypothetical protein
VEEGTREDRKLAYSWMTDLVIDAGIIQLELMFNPRRIMHTTRFLVKLTRAGAHQPQYVQRVGHVSVETTSDKKLALIMGKLTAEDAMKAIQNPRCTPELVAVKVPA